MGNEFIKLNVPSVCPLCGGAVKITRIQCDDCGSEINGSFVAGGLCLLPQEYQKFIVVFLRQRGNIRQVENELGISYPTINKMLETINAMLGDTKGTVPLSRKEILDAIDKGQMSVKDATLAS